MRAEKDLGIHFPKKERHRQRPFRLCWHVCAYANWLQNFIRIQLALFLLFHALSCSLKGQTPQINFSPPDANNTISLSANHASSWIEGQNEVWHLTGSVSIRQSNTVISANEAILWVETKVDDSPQSLSIPARRVIVFMEGGFSMTRGVDPNLSRIQDNQWLGRLFTTKDLQIDAIPIRRPIDEPAIMKRAAIAREQEVKLLSTIGNQIQLVQFETNGPPSPGSQPAKLGNQSATDTGPTLISPQTGYVYPASTQNSSAASQGGFEPQNSTQQGGGFPNFNGGFPQPTAPIPRTDVDFDPRSANGNFNLRTVAGRNADEQIFVGTGGVKVNIDSERLQNVPQLANEPNQRLTILSDSIVAWRDSSSGTDRWEIYLEGDIVFVLGKRTIYAKRMYYDPNFKRGTILDSEMFTPLPKFEGLARLKADVIRQVDENNLRAYGAAVTTSRVGVPRYWLQSGALAIRRDQQTVVDPNTGLAESQDRFIADSGQNSIYLGGVPVFYWPRITTDLGNSAYYLRSIRVGNDRGFGFQIRTAWDLFQLLGRPRPEGTDWVGHLDYLSDRGVGFGSDYDFVGKSFFGIPGDVETMIRSYSISDGGTDNLGFDRRSVPLEKKFRGQWFLNHRHRFQNGWTMKAEVGYVSDRNFLEQYYERHWDESKDYTTGIWLQRNWFNQSFNLTADYRINDFFTETENLPKLDHFMIGQSFLFDRFVYHGHSHIGYRKFRTANAPTNAIDLAKFDPLAWETNQTSGIVGATRHEIDAPIQMGAVKVVPYILGEADYWQEDLTGNDLFRGFGQVGIKSSLPMWRVDPTIGSELFNVNGLAHKVTFESEVLFAEASQDINELPLYDNLDDNSQEHFRRRFLFDTFGLVAGDDVPLNFDERYFAHRYGMQRYVSSPTTEIADDLAQVRLAMRNRWQTKRGMPGRERIIDWITLDIQGSFYPKPSRDNFGADFGMLDYDFRWHVGDRLSVLSDGFYDFFSQGLRTTSIGLLTSRPGVGNAYVGMRSIEGPLSSNVLQTSLNYRMSDRWGINTNSSLDFGDTGTIGSRLGIVFIGESFLWNVGVNHDVSRGNTGFVFSVEPRFLRTSKILPLGGQPIRPASSRWLE